MPRGATTKEVHPDEVGDVARSGSSGHVGDRALLRDAASLEHDEAIGERHRVEQLVGHQHPRAGEGREVETELAAQLGAGTDVERGQRLVEEHQARLDHERPRQRNALLLAPGERSRLGIGTVRETDAFEPRTGAAARVRSCHTAAAKPEGDVLEHGQVREQQVVLEHHPDRPSLRLDEHVPLRIVDDVPVEGHAARFEGEQPRERTEQRRLARAVRSEHGNRLALGGVDRRVQIQVAESEPDVRLKTHEQLRTTGRAAARAPRSTPGAARG